MQLSLTLLVLLACVPKGKYDEALADQDRLYDRIDGMKSAMNTLSTEVDRVNAELRTTETALAESNQKLANKVTEAGQMQQDIEEMKEALRDLERRRAQTEQSLAAYQDLIARFQSMIDAGTLKVKVVNGRMLVELATDILFPPGSARLSKDGKTAIEDVATVLASIPDRQYQVAGHTDNVPISTAQFPSNWHLGSARAISVVQVMVGAGLSPDRVSVSSFADYQPIDTNRTREGKAANRRIEIVIVPDLSVMPGYSELEAMAGGKELPTVDVPLDIPPPAP